MKNGLKDESVFLFFRRAHRFAFVKGKVEFYVVQSVGLFRHRLLHEVERLHREYLFVYPQRGQFGGQDLADVGVVETDDRNVVGNFTARFFEIGIERAGRPVAMADEGGGHVCGIEFGHGEAAFDVGVYVAAGFGHVEFVERPKTAEVAVCYGVGKLDVPDEAYLSVSLAYEVFRQRVARIIIVHIHIIKIIIRAEKVYADHGLFQLFYLAEQIPVYLPRNEYAADGGFLHETLDVGHGGGQRVVHDEVKFRAGTRALVIEMIVYGGVILFVRAQQKILLYNVHETVRRRSGGAHVAQLVRQVEYALAEFGADAVLVFERFVHGNRGYIQLFGDRFQGNFFHGHNTSLLFCNSIITFRKGKCKYY